MSPKSAPKKRRPISIQKKLIFSYVLISLVCMLFYFIYTYLSSGRLVKAEKKAVYTNSAMSVCNTIKTQMDNCSNYAGMLTSDSSIQYLFGRPMDIYEQLNVVRERIDSPFSLYKAQDRAVLDIKLYTDNKDIVITSDFIEIVDSYAEINENSHSFCWKISDDNQRLSLITPVFYIHSPAYEPVGYLKIDLDASQIFQEALSNSDPNLLMSISGADSRRVFESVSAAAADGREPVPIADMLLENTDLTAAFSVPAAAFNSGTVNMIRTSVLALLACLVIAGAFILLFSRLITKNIHKLISIVDNIDQSNLDITIDVNQNDEIGVLSGCLNGMLKRINQLIEDICRAKDAEKQAELECLRTQITPHFLYNTMDTINWMVIQGTTDPICSVTALLSKYYRTMLNKGEFYTTLSRELDNIKAYIGIQMIMHNDSFDVEYDCDESLLQYEVPNFILQPAVENAIVHGIDPVTSRRCRIRIEIRRSQDGIHIQIGDNGVGITERQSRDLNGGNLNEVKNKGYGLSNVQERIHLAFGEEYGLTVTGKPGEGTVTSFRLPFFKRSGEAAPPHDPEKGSP